MPRAPMRLIAALALLASAGDAVRADDEPDPEDGTHLGSAIFESAVALAIPAAWYWNTKEHQQVDFELDGSWNSWRSKLFSTDKLIFDTNPFHVNAIRHPLVGAIDYQIVRTNGFSPVAAGMFALIKGAAWEYFIEYREDPSINDILFNLSGGIAIGEPMFELGQLWRGSKLSIGDRVRTAMLSPFDAYHDTFRPQHAFIRPSRWAAIDLEAGALQRRSDGVTRGEIAVAADLDLVNNRAFAEGGPWDGDVKTGSWSRLRASASFGKNDDGSGLSATQLRTQTILFGHYHQDAGGAGTLLALGTAFSYRQDWLNVDRDHFAIAHLIGPQIQLSSRSRNTTILWDAAAYADFGLVEALVFSPVSPFPKPPPYFSSLQADGYIDAIGVTATSRLRVFTGPWRGDVEVDAHLLHQIVNHDRGSEGNESPRQVVNSAVTAYGIDESRGLWRAQVTYQPSTWGVGLLAGGAQRSSTWEDQRRTVSDLSLGAQLQLAY